MGLAKYMEDNMEILEQRLQLMDQNRYVGYECRQSDNGYHQTYRPASPAGYQRAVVRNVNGYRESRYN